MARFSHRIGARSSKSGEPNRTANSRGARLKQDTAERPMAARGEHPSSGDSRYPDRMETARKATTSRERIAVLSMNMFIRPEWIHSGRWMGSGDHKDLRATLLLRMMQQLDIVILQEMFEVGTRQRRFVREAYKLGFKYHAGSVWPSLLDSYLIDGGLLILSRFPIVERGQHVFTCGAGSDGCCAKGVLYARVQLSPDLSDSLHIFTTHTQAGDQLKEYTIRSKQIQELRSFVAKTLEDDPYAPLLIAGDFNLDSRHDLHHDAGTGAVARSVPCVESAIYCQLYNDLHGILAAGRKMIDLMKTHDTTKLKGHLHPITNGDGHSRLVHTTDPLSLDKDGKCIDFMFFSPGIRERRAADGDVPSCSLRVVPEHTHVVRGDVASIQIADGHRASPRSLPITHISDHYGLRAEFELEISGLGTPDGAVVPLGLPLCALLQQHFPPTAFVQKTKRMWQLKIMLLLFVMMTAGSTVVLVVLQQVARILTFFRS